MAFFGTAFARSDTEAPPLAPTHQLPRSRAAESMLEDVASTQARAPDISGFSTMQIQRVTPKFTGFYSKKARILYNARSVQSALHFFGLPVDVQGEIFNRLPLRVLALVIKTCKTGTSLVPWDIIYHVQVDYVFRDKVKFHQCLTDYVDYWLRPDRLQKVSFANLTAQEVQSFSDAFQALLDQTSNAVEFYAPDPIPINLFYGYLLGYDTSDLYHRVLDRFNSFNVGREYAQYTDVLWNSDWDPLEEDITAPRILRGGFDFTLTICLSDLDEFSVILPPSICRQLIDCSVTFVVVLDEKYTNVLLDDSTLRSVAEVMGYSVAITNTAATKWNGPLLSDACVFDGPSLEASKSPFVICADLSGARQFLEHQDFFAARGIRPIFAEKFWVEDNGVLWLAVLASGWLTQSDIAQFMYRMLEKKFVTTHIEREIANLLYQKVDCYIVQEFGARLIARDLDTYPDNLTVLKITGEFELSSSYDAHTKKLKKAHQMLRTVLLALELRFEKRHELKAQKTFGYHAALPPQPTPWPPAPTSFT